MGLDERVDVVVVGGGIGGGALAGVLAQAGIDVLVLERQTAYRDKVRGENLQPWGVAEAMRLGLDGVLLEAGGGHVTRLVPYDEVLPPKQAEAAAIDLSALLPGVPGVIDVGHPEACTALSARAEAAGACFQRGVGDLEVLGGPRPSVRYELDDVGHDVACRLIVGADGRASSVRRQLGVTLNETAPRTIGAGLLVTDLEAVAPDVEFVGTEGDVHFLCFPRPGGMARLYLLYAVADRARLGGADRGAAFLDAFRGLRCVPAAEALGHATVAGPCAAYPMNDTWTDTPCVQGAVLVGDAAGWSDPIIGQGLSVALRDARMVADVLVGSGDWSPAAFEGYVEERAERMRRLRVVAHIDTDLRATFTAEARARRAVWMASLATDPMLAGIMGALAGPENVPPESVSDEAIRYVQALA